MTGPKPSPDISPPGRERPDLDFGWNYRLRVCREGVGLSQSALGELIGSNQPYIARCEAGTACPSLVVQVRIARAMGLPVAAMFPRDEIEEKTPCP